MNKEKHSRYFNMLIIAIIFTAISVWYFSGGSQGNAVTFDTTNTALTLKGAAGTSVTVKYADISKLELSDDFDPGTAAGNAGIKSHILYGTWSSAAAGSYQAFIDDRINYVIIVTSGSGKIVFNTENDDTTSRLYESMLDYCGLSAQ